MILADTSAWVEFDRATGTAGHLRLVELVRSGEVRVTEPVVMEVLAGARDERRLADLRRLMRSVPWLPVDPVADFEGAARIYRACRSAGVTPRGLVDCMVANVALRTGVALLAADRDFEQIATVVPLRLDRP